MNDFMDNCRDEYMSLHPEYEEPHYTEDQIEVFELMVSRNFDNWVTRVFEDEGFSNVLRYEREVI